MAPTARSHSAGTSRCRQCPPSSSNRVPPPPSPRTAPHDRPSRAPKTPSSTAAPLRPASTCAAGAAARMRSATGGCGGSPKASARRRRAKRLGAIRRSPGPPNTRPPRPSAGIHGGRAPARAHGRHHRGDVGRDRRRQPEAERRRERRRRLLQDHRVRPARLALHQRQRRHGAEAVADQHVGRLGMDRSIPFGERLSRRLARRAGGRHARPDRPRTRPSRAPRAPAEHATTNPRSTTARGSAARGRAQAPGVDAAQCCGATATGLTSSPPASAVAPRTAARVSAQVSSLRLLGHAAPEELLGTLHPVGDRVVVDVESFAARVPLPSQRGRRARFRAAARPSRSERPAARAALRRTRAHAGSRSPAATRARCVRSA